MMKLVIIVLFNQVIFRFQPLIFQDVGDQVGSRLEEAGLGIAISIPWDLKYPSIYNI